MNATLIKDVNGEDFDLSQLHGLPIQSSVPLQDGIYISEDKEFFVQEQKLVEYWPLPHPDQLTLF
ncbi:MULTISPECIES: hypothetical protein [Bacillus subtilis group]|uniref:hypothetical protein n=1 Tax=Bacillus subtilis group TaxID=653685 RepID=UPI001B016EF3|nr:MULTISPECIES: hypothetical protein [Bacillus subtilis group]MED4337841.1 hypothetical protein [Bacillus licheniformis]MED4371155.1 hypothetical protein [Bacillus licheniformis]GIN55074.1 hypothetical protein J36TS2_39680 [Bacillus paralicheniformis]